MTQPLQIPILAELLLRGDGSYILKPVIPAGGTDQWVRSRDAAKILRIHPRDLYRLLGVYLVFRRPTPSRYEISLPSILDYQVAIGDAEFWNQPKRQALLQKRVQRQMNALAEASMKLV